MEGIGGRALDLDWGTVAGSKRAQVLGSNYFEGSEAVERYSP